MPAADSNVLEQLQKAYRVWQETKGTDSEEFMGFVADEIRFGSITDVLAEAGAEKMYSSKEEVRRYLEALPKTWEMEPVLPCTFLAGCTTRVCRLYWAVQAYSTGRIHRSTTTLESIRHRS